MLRTKRDLDSHINWTQYEIKNLQDKYWSLYHKHELLLKHLGLTEHTTPETKELRTKGGPERET